MTGLEALYKLVQSCFNPCDSDEVLNDKTIVEKSLKALEIIKEKVMPLVCISDGFVYDGELFHRIEISEEDSILLKEVLSNERN